MASTTFDKPLDTEVDSLREQIETSYNVSTGISGLTAFRTNKQIVLNFNNTNNPISVSANSITKVGTLPQSMKAIPGYVFMGYATDAQRNGCGILVQGQDVYMQAPVASNIIYGTVTYISN
jgi:hypothetical protein